MEVKLKRKYEFLNKKFKEILLPTLFMVMSEKISVVIDIMIISFLLGSTQTSVINLASPLTYFTGIFYILFGQGGNLLALRAQTRLKFEKVNYYFSLSIIGIIVVTIIYLLLVFVFMDNILILLNTPPEIFDYAKQYISIILFYYPLNCYILVISFFIRSDGFAKMPFYAILIANILNIILDVLFLKGFNWGIASTALASVLGYLVGAIYISTYLINKKGTYKLCSLAKYKIKDILLSIKEIALNTPEVIGKIFFAIKMAVLTYLCSTYWGVAGLLAFLIYDNSETFVYIFLSGIMKTMSPIVTVLNKERDFAAVHYMMKYSLYLIIYISVPVSILFFIYPEILLKLFNVTNPQHGEIVILAIRITAFSLVGRCISYLLANYTQAIEKNKISSIITFSEEFLIVVVGGVILTQIMGGMGIWVAILLAECIPVLIYAVYAIKNQKRYKNQISELLMIQNSKLIAYTYSREDMGQLGEDLDEESRKLLIELKKSFKDNAEIVINSIDDLCTNMFQTNEDLEDIDITVRYLEDELYVVLTSDGKLYNPFSNEELMKSENFEKLSKTNCEIKYDEILGFNKSYFILKKANPN